MIIQLEPGRTPGATQRALKALGLWTTAYPAPSPGVGAQLIVASHSASVAPERVLAVEGVAEVFAPESGRPLVDAHPARVSVSGVAIGAGAPAVLMAGPCSVESEEQIHAAAALAARSGATFLRGGCFKPRTSPYAFRGTGPEGLAWMRAAADAHGLNVVTEAMAPAQVDVVAEHADLFQIGARNMQNFDLLHAVGRAGKATLLKRGLSATIDEWLYAAEHLLDAGAPSVLFCERGVRGFDDTTRFTFDISAVAQLTHVHGLPVIADPSHAAGRKDLIGPLGAAALAAGAHGLIIETHPDPAVACSDGPQQLDPEELAAITASWGFGAEASPRAAAS
jgi:3-deoxy-7-phosphoheptulonate synthase